MDNKKPLRMSVKILPMTDSKGMGYMIEVYQKPSPNCVYVSQEIGEAIIRQICERLSLKIEGEKDENN